MEQYIIKHCDVAKEYLESGIALKNAQQIQQASAIYANMAGLVKGFDEQSEIVKANGIRAYTALCIVDPANALQYLQHALEIDSTHPDVLNNLGFVYHMTYSDFAQSIKYYQACLSATPKYLTAYLGITNVYRVLRHHQLELEYCQKGVAELPDSPDLWNALGLALLNNGNYASFEKIRHCFITALALHPTPETQAKIHVNLGHLHGLCGEPALATQDYLDSIACDPTHRTAYQNLLMNIHYFSDDDLSSSVLVKIMRHFKIPKKAVHSICDLSTYLHRRIVDLLYPEHVSAVPPEMRSGVTRNIVVGYMTFDLIDHAVSYFIRAIFEHYNNTSFDVYIYSNNVYNPDTIAGIRCTAYRPISGMNAADVAALMKKDQLDILVDLSGHTSGNRLDVVALRPAPVLLSYCGYPDDTGFPFVKRITDAYTEKFSRHSGHSDNSPASPGSDEGCLPMVTLPRLFLCYTPKETTPEWLAEHVKHYRHFKPGGTVVFGCFAKLQKINRHVIAVFKEILQRLPKSRLVLKSRYFEDAGILSAWKQKFDGVHDRVELMRGTKTSQEHLESFKNIDIHLDTFPYSGTTITTESLYMNVPVVTFAPVHPSRTVGHVQRVSGSILHSMGLAKECIANTKSDYVDKAVALVGLLPMSIRKRFLKSPISQPQAFVRDLENVFINEWRGGDTEPSSTGAITIS